MAARIKLYLKTPFVDTVAYRLMAVYIKGVFYFERLGVLELCTHNWQALLKLPKWF